MLTAAQEGSIPPTPSIHRLRRGLPGYLILFAPHAFASQRQLLSRKPPSPPVFLLISTHFTATLGIPLSSPVLKKYSFRCRSAVEPQYFTSDLYSRLHALTPSKSGQRLPPTYYRGCWHVVSRGLFFGYRHFSSPIKEVYDPKTFILHAASLHQGFPHCAIFPTAASRGSLGRVSVPMWPFSLSARLPIVALVVHYTTN